MATIIVKHRVKDFDAWLPFFEKHADARRAATCTSARVFRSVDDPNHVTVVFEVSDPAKFQALGASSDMRAILEQSGVIGTPTFSLLNAAGSYAV
jgi:quinol monooxygenase YgiN